MSVVNGTYDLKLQTPMGEKHATLILEAEGNVLNGSFITKNESVPITGTTTANQVDFETTVTTPLGKITARMVGTVDGDNLTAESKLMFATVKISGVRKK